MKNVLPKLGILVIFSLGLYQPALAAVVFTINGTDKQTGELLGSTEMVVEEHMLKMTHLDSGEGTSEVARQSSTTYVAGESAAAVAGAMAGGYASGGGDTDDEDSEMIYNAQRKEIVVVDNKNEEYSIVDKAFLANVKSQFGGAGAGQQMGQMNSMIQQAYETALANLDTQNMTPQERAAAEQMLRNTLGMSGAPAPSGAATEAEMIKGEKDTVNGYPVTWYERAGKRRIAVADWDVLGPGAEARDTIESFFEFMGEMSAGGFESDSGFPDAMQEIGGFPVAGSEEDEDWSLESITERDLDPDAFEPPKGYRLRTMGPQ